MDRQNKIGSPKKSLILPQPLLKWLNETLLSVSTNYNYYNNLKVFYNTKYIYQIFYAIKYKEKIQNEKSRG